MRSLQHEFLVNAPIAKVVDFHSGTQALKQLTPYPLFVKFNQMNRLKGSCSELTLWLGPIPIQCVAVHTAVTPSEGSSDTQVEGPFQTWVHKHTIQSLPGGNTRIIDHVQSQPGGDFLWGMISRSMLITLPILFSYRRWQTREVVEAS